MGLECLGMSFSVWDIFGFPVVSHFPCYLQHFEPVSSYLHGICSVFSCETKPSRADGRSKFHLELKCYRDLYLCLLWIILGYLRITLRFSLAWFGVYSGLVQSLFKVGLGLIDSL